MFKEPNDLELKRMYHKLKWTFNEFVQPAFEDMVKNYSYAIAIFDMWAVKLFDKASKVKAIKWGANVDQSKCVVTYWLTLGYMGDKTNVIYAARMFVWEYDYDKKTVNWTVRWPDVDL